MYTHTKEEIEKLTPDEALRYLVDGNNRFVNNLRANRDLLKLVNETSTGQKPFATILSCMDSRTSAELIFDQGLGDIFSIRIAGNVLNDDIIGSMEFATEVVGSKVILVLGHTSCGAIKGACDHVELGKLTGLLKKVQPAIDAENLTVDNRKGSNMDFVNRVAQLNVEHTMKEIIKQSEIIRSYAESGKIKIAGGMYSVETGEVEFFGQEESSKAADVSLSAR